MSTITLTSASQTFGTAGAETIIGSSGNDSIHGAGGNDLLDGGAGDDIFNGLADGSRYDTSGNKTILGGTGNDLIFDGTGNDWIDGGVDNDTIYSNSGNDTIAGGAGNDSINGIRAGSGFSGYYATSGNKIMSGDGGNDFLLGGTGADTIDGGVGNDTLYGLGGNDSLTGGDGDDVIYDQGSTSGNNTLLGGAGNDELSTFTSTGSNLLDGGDGDDAIDGGSGNDTLIGGAGNDLFDADAGNDLLDGSAGNDTLDGGAGNDSLSGGDGNDVIYDQGGTSGNNTLLGGAGNDDLSAYTSTGSNSLDGGDGDDTITGGSGNDTLIGGAGNDSINSDAGNDFLDGGAGVDTLYGGAGDDSLSGGAGNDVLYDQAGGNDTLVGGDGDDRLDTFSGAGSDSLVGGAGNDTLIGGSGNDTLDGGAGINRLSGGAGNDTYIISSSHTHIEDSGGTSDAATISVDFYKVPSSIENPSYAAGVKALPYWISSLLPDEASGDYFNDLIYVDPSTGKKTVYFYFPSSLPSYDTSADHRAGFVGFTSDQKSFTRNTLTYISSVVGLSFVETTDSTIASNRFTIAFANNTQTGSAGYAVYPSDPTDQSLGSPVGGDFFLAKTSGAPTTLVANTYAALTVIHELGHALGLKHPGSYDAGGQIPAGPFLSSAEDTSAWTVMSYQSTSAQYNAIYQALDIAALQYLYGPSPTASSGANTHSISATAPNFIWDGGGIDLIDASSVGQGATIYLSPGYQGFLGASAASTITAAGQITVNFGSAIENLRGTAFADSLFGNELGNSIEGGAGNDSLSGGLGNDSLFGGDGIDSVLFAGQFSNYVVSESGGIYSVSDSIPGRDGTDTIQGIERFVFSDRTLDATQVLLSNPPVCFVRGTLIQTVFGPRPVEDLQVNDRLSFYVEPTSSDSAKVKWIGRQTFHPAMADLIDYLPIKISANALGPGHPFQNLYVSPDHAVLFDSTLIHAKALINGTSIIQMNAWTGDVEYFHIETEDHQLIYANGVPAETFIDNVSRRQFDNYAEFEAMYPGAPMMTELDIPRVLFRRQLATETMRRLKSLEELWVSRNQSVGVATELG